VDGEKRRQLDENGFIILKNVLNQAQVVAILGRLETLWQMEGERAGEENYIEAGARRLANLADKGEIFKSLYAHPEVLAAVRVIMGDAIRLSMLNARDVPPGSESRMPFHTDTDGGRKPDALGFNSATAIWMLDPFTSENGATALVPGTHWSGLRPKEVMADPSVPHPDEVILTGEPGDVLVFNGHCWHAGRPNKTGRPRRAVLAHYLRADVPRDRSRRQELGPASLAALTPIEKELLGIDDG